MSNMQTIISQFDLQTKLFKNATADYTESNSQSKTGDANHAKWLTGHIVASRYGISSLLGLNEKEPYPELFGNRKGAQAGVQYPSMHELVKDWDHISEKVVNRLKEMSDKDFEAAAPFPHPMSDGTLKGLIGFFAHHEAYTIGQVAYARRVFGMEPMKYN